MRKKRRSERPRRDADEFIAEVAAVNDLTKDAPQAILLLGELRRLTRWDDNTLCDRLGCRPERWTTMGTGQRDAGDDSDAIRHSLEFLTLVRDVTGLVELARDCRRMLNKAFELCAQSGGPASEPVPRIRAALEAAGPDGYSAWQILELGEIGAGWRLAALHMDSGVAHERALATNHITGPIVARGPHLSRHRFELLFGGRAAQALGIDVSARMRAHVLECAKCAALAARVDPELDFDELARESELDRQDELYAGEAEPAAA